MAELPRVLDVTLSSDVSLTAPPRAHAPPRAQLLGGHVHGNDAPRQTPPVSPRLRSSPRHVDDSGTVDHTRNVVNNNDHHHRNDNDGSGHTDAGQAYYSPPRAHATSREVAATTSRSHGYGSATTAAEQSFHTVSLQRGRRQVLCSAEADADEFTVYHNGDAARAGGRYGGGGGGGSVRSTVCMDRHIHERMHDDLRRAYKRVNNPESGMPDRGPLFTEAICQSLRTHDAHAGVVPGGGGGVAASLAASASSLAAWPLPSAMPGASTSSSSSRAAHGLHRSRSRPGSRSNSPRMASRRQSNGGSAGGGGGGNYYNSSNHNNSADGGVDKTATAASSSSLPPSTGSRSVYNDLVRPALHARPHYLPGMDNIDAFIEQERARNFVHEA